MFHSFSFLEKGFNNSIFSTRHQFRHLTKFIIWLFLLLSALLAIIIIAIITFFLFPYIKARPFELSSVFLLTTVVACLGDFTPSSTQDFHFLLFSCVSIIMNTITTLVIYSLLSSEERFCCLSFFFYLHPFIYLKIHDLGDIFLFILTYSVFLLR